MHFDCVIGSIIGDIAGSTLELKDPAKYRKEDVKYFLKQGRVTDDSVLTIATLEAIHNQKTSPEDFRDIYFEYGNKYKDVGYGKGFKQFLNDKQKKHSSGNGCLMRLSPIMLIDNPVFRLEVAQNSIEYTHNHLDSFYAIETYCDFLKNEKLDSYFYGNDFEKLFECHSFSSLAIPTLRDALTVIWTSSSFEECLLKSLQLGGDTDTIAAIACGLASKFYTIPKEWVEIAEEKLKSLPGLYEKYISL